jgi:hypothetical protein
VSTNTRIALLQQPLLLLLLTERLAHHAADSKPCHAPAVHHDSSAAAHSISSTYSTSQQRSQHTISTKTHDNMFQGSSYNPCTHVPIS